MSERDERVEALAEAAFWREQEAGSLTRDRGGYTHRGFVDGYCAALLDSPAMRDLLAEERARALREAADGMPFGYMHAAHLLRARADEEAR